MGSLIPLLFIFGIFAFIISRVIKMSGIVKNFTTGKTIDDYKASHPECTTSDGKVLCFSCKTNNIWLKEVGKTPSSLLHSHVCRQCGIELYRSVIKMWMWIMWIVNLIDNLKKLKATGKQLAKLHIFQLKIWVVITFITQMGLF